jgi:hypothetical protein
VRSATSSVRQYPKTENAVVTVSTAYYGADAQTIAGFITQPLEQAISQAQGIDYLSSTSVSGVSTITATLRLNYDANKALTQIQTQVSSVRNQLPPQAQQPVLNVLVGETIDAMYMGYRSDTLPANSITDYLARVVKPKLDSIQGVQTAEILGGRQFALRAWLDPARLAAHNITASDVFQAMSANNYLAAVGTTKGQMVSVDLTAGTDLHSVEEFKKMSIKQKDGAIVRLEDVANVVLGAEEYDSNVSFSGKLAVFIGIKVAPDANVLDVAKRVREAMPGIQSQLPAGLTGEIVYDGTTFITSSIQEVVKTLIEALLIVTLVIFLFLGSFRAVIIPVIAMPLSLIGTFFVMLALGYSMNLLTLLALVLAIGLVVDDAIIVVENVDRHMKEEGKTPLQSALLAARELGGPILAMTVVLVAVYVPIGFQKGLTGALFGEFAFTLAGAVTVSAIVALTLSPMMCARFFKAEQESGRFVQFIDRQFERVRGAYQRMLHGTLTTFSVIVVMGLMLFGATLLLDMTSKSELAPEEDQGFLFYQLKAAPNSTAQQMIGYSQQMFTIGKELPEHQMMFQIITPGQGFGGMAFTPWSERSRNAHELQQVLQEKWSAIAGGQIFVFPLPPLPGAQGAPIQVVINTTEPFQNLNEVVQAVLKKAQDSGKFWFVDADLKIDKPQSTVVVDRDMISTLGPYPAGRRQRARRRTRRRLRELFLDRGALVQGDTASAAGRPPESRPGARLLRARTERNGDAGRDDGHAQELGRAAIDQPLPAAELRDDLRGERHVAGRGAAIPARCAAGSRAERVPDRLFRPVAPVRAGIRRFRHDLAVRSDHRVPCARGTVQQPARSDRDPGLGADGAVRRDDLRQPDCEPEHLHAGRARHLDGSDQQARDPYRAICQRVATRRHEQARRDRARRRGATAPDPDDDRRDGARRSAAGDRVGRWRRWPLQHGPGDRHRSFDRHAVHAVRRAGVLHAARRRPSCRTRCECERRWRTGAGIAGSRAPECISPWLLFRRLQTAWEIAS